MQLIARWLFVLARSRLGRILIGWAFHYMSFAIPVQRLRETGTLIAFLHPRPSHTLHILIVPKRQVLDFTTLKPGDGDFVFDMVGVVKSLVDEYDLERRGYSLVTNGGAFQDVAQLHFHLISDTAN